jgi:hypothetical protein
MDTFLEEYSPLKLSQEEIVDLNRPVTISEIEFLIKKKRNCLQTKVQDQMASLGNPTTNTEKNSYQSFSNSYIKLKMTEEFLTHFTRPALPRYQNQTKACEKLKANIPDEQ